MKLAKQEDIRHEASGQKLRQGIGASDEVAGWEHPADLQVPEQLQQLLAREALARPALHHRVVHFLAFLVPQTNHQVALQVLFHIRQVADQLQLDLLEQWPYHDSESLALELHNRRVYLATEVVLVEVLLRQLQQKLVPRGFESQLAALTASLLVLSDLLQAWYRVSQLRQRLPRVHHP